ncbi:Smr/MutS family protein [Niveibacterium umoris]|nr:Smr/MutS family protein [Niveibacterium umoris]
MRKKPQARTPESDDADIDFAAAVGGAKPLRAHNRAEIATPKPAPIPRARPAEDAPEAPCAKPAVPMSDAAALRDALKDVVALRDDGRIDPDRLGRRVPTGMPATQEIGTDTLAAWLDRAEHPHDPAALFRHAVGPAAPLRDTGRVHLAPPSPAPQPRQREADDQQVLADSIVAPLSFEDRLDMGDEAVFIRAGIPRRVLTDLRRGRWVVQAELDLHGMDREEARTSLAQFLALRLSRGERCVRVIHGKGLGSPGRIGVLKQLSRNWLAQREEILAFCQAKPHDGGDGAVLVLLRAPKPSA